MQFRHCTAREVQPWTPLANHSDLVFYFRALRATAKGEGKERLQLQ